MPRYELSHRSNLRLPVEFTMVLTEKKYPKVEIAQRQVVACPYGLI